MGSLKSLPRGCFYTIDKSVAPVKKISFEFMKWLEKGHLPAGGMTAKITFQIRVKKCMM